MFNKSFLPKALFEFVVISDSHYMLDPGGDSLEFGNRRKQSVRREVALRMAAALTPKFMVHNGDMVQEYPDNLERFYKSIGESLEQMRACGVEPYYVAGNHDVGDKPDPTAPASHVSQEVLDWYHRRFGQSWYSFDQEDCHFVVLNSQIMNGTLPDAAEQVAWVEKDLAEHAKKRLFILLHMPPYLFDETESSMGHYDNLANPARTWLLDLVRAYKVEMLVAGHVHFAFFDHLAETRYAVLASPVFTRPGFSCLFAGPPPPQRGRDDVPKFGFYLMRVRADKTDLHFIRTSGLERLPPNTEERFITRVSGTLPQSPLGVTLSQPLATVAEIPRAWPAAIREKVRNDYPLLACMEMGVGYVRAPLTDFLDTFQRRRLEILRKEGVKLNAVAIFSEEFDIVGAMSQVRPRVDGLEIQIAGTLYPSEKCIEVIKAIQERFSVSVTLSPIVCREATSGKQFPRFRLGCTPQEIPMINQCLAGKGVAIERVICKLNNDQSLCNQIQEIAETVPLSHIANIDFSLEFSATNDQTNANLAAEALFSMATISGSRIYFEPFSDLDRTMDVTHGLLDTLCNPRSASCTLQSLNTIMYSRPLKVSKHPLRLQQINGLRALQFSTDTSTYTLLLHSGLESTASEAINVEAFLEVKEGEPLKIYQLSEITLQSVNFHEATDCFSLTPDQTPVLIESPPID
jgi:predicted phosphodiesterase